MNEILLNLIYFITSYILIFLIYVFIINRKKKTYTDGSKQLEVNYIVSKFNLDRRKTKYSTIKWCVNILNPLIHLLSEIILSLTSIKINPNKFVPFQLFGFSINGKSFLLNPIPQILSYGDASTKILFL